MRGLWLPSCLLYVRLLSLSSLLVCTDGEVPPSKLVCEGALDVSLFFTCLNCSSYRSLYTMFTYNLSLVFFHTFDDLLMLFLTLKPHLLLSTKHSHKLIDKSLLFSIEARHDLSHSGTIHEHWQVVLGLSGHQGEERVFSLHRRETAYFIVIWRLLRVFLLILSNNCLGFN